MYCHRTECIYWTCFTCLCALVLSHWLVTLSVPHLKAWEWSFTSSSCSHIHINDHFYKSWHDCHHCTLCIPICMWSLSRAATSLPKSLLRVLLSSISGLEPRNHCLGYSLAQSVVSRDERKKYLWSRRCVPDSISPSWTQSKCLNHL